MIRAATPADLLFIRDLQRKFHNEIGFIPNAATARELEAGNVAIGELNADDAGFLLIRPRLAAQPTTAAIIQAAVHTDAQRRSVGLALINAAEQAARLNGSTILQATCRSNLEANLFWRAAGFTAIATRPASKTYRQPLIIYRVALVDGTNLRIIPPDRKPRGPGGHWVKVGTEVLPTLLQTDESA